MFYSKFMFVKKGPLSKVWIAAHFHRKLNKTHVLGTDINISAKSILDPSAPLALRLSGQLLLGLVRIYQRKVKYLQEDCSDALTKMKMIFRPGVVDLPADSGTAPSAQITHADNAIDIDYIIPEIPLDDLDTILDPNLLTNSQEPDFSINETHNFEAVADDITLPNNAADDNMMFDGDHDLLPDFGEMELVPFEDELGDDSKVVSDVELPREDNQNEGFEPDFDHEQSQLEVSQGLNKSTDQSLMGQEFSNLDTTTDNDNQSVVSEKLKEKTPVVAPKPKPKKRKLEKQDVTTELSGKQIGAQLKDTSDIVVQREFIPFAKKSKFRHRRVNIGLHALLNQPTSLNVSFLAPALLEAYQKFDGSVDVDVVEQKGKKKQKKAAEVEEEPEVVLQESAEFEFQDNYDDVGLDLDISTSVANDSFAVTPGKDSVAPEDEEEEEKHTSENDAHQDAVTNLSQRKALDDDVAEFFGEKKSSQSSQQEEKEELFGWSARTKKMHQTLANHMKNKKSVQFDKIVEGKARNTAAGVFYQLLVLKSHSIIDVDQKNPYTDICVLKDKNFSSAGTVH